MNGEVMETLFDKFYELMRFMVTISIALTIFLFVVIFFAAAFFVILEMDCAFLTTAITFRW